MDIMNRYSNMNNSAYEVVLFYCVNGSLTVLEDGSWSIRDSKAKVL